MILWYLLRGILLLWAETMILLFYLQEVFVAVWLTVLMTSIKTASVDSVTRIRTAVRRWNWLFWQLKFHHRLHFLPRKCRLPFFTITSEPRTCIRSIRTFHSTSSYFNRFFRLQDNLFLFHMRQKCGQNRTIGGQDKESKPLDLGFKVNLFLAQPRKGISSDADGWIPVAQWWLRFSKFFTLALWALQ